MKDAYGIAMDKVTISVPSHMTSRFGPWVVHLGIGAPNRWTVTHAHVGMAAAHFERRDAAEGLARDLRRFAVAVRSMRDWSSLPKASKDRMRAIVSKWRGANI